MAQKLPKDAVEYFLALGPGRSYAAVARHFGVSKKTVARRAADEDWMAQAEETDRPTRELTVAAMKDRQTAELLRSNGLQDAFKEVISPQRMKALVATLFKQAVQKDDFRAAKFLVERALGRPRNETLNSVCLDLPDGLETTKDVRRAANALLQGIADGSIAPEDAQRATSVLESARNSIETEELEMRLAEIEEQLKAKGR